MISRERLILTLSLALAFFVLLMGAWWIYLMIHLNHHLKTMLIWEGGAFLTFILILSFTLIYLFLVDRKKSRSLKIFLASMTHELKTPLASMRLQAEVIDELIENCDKSKLKTLTARLIQDANGLEFQFDKILQLSKMELGGKIVTTKINITDFLNRVAKDFEKDIKIEINSDNTTLNVDGDELALLVVFRNLFENSIRHGNSGPVIITIKDNSSTVQINYQDSNRFSGDANKLGTLFYKHDSPKGSGIGLYLSKRILDKIEGNLLISNINSGGLAFNITLKRSGGIDE